nr:transketolase [Saprospiraceae bacterium]
MDNLEKLKKTASQIRRDIVRMVYHAQSGHPGGSLGCADFFTALYFSELKHKPEFNMKGANEDVFILSNGHISPVFYASLARSGYFDVKELNTFRSIDSRLQGHPATHEELPGVRVATGSLGQGLSVAIGIALSKKLAEDDRYVYALTGDGELQEGQIWEALMFAAHHQVDNLIVTVDWNGQQIDGPNEEVMSLGDLEAKWKSFGWEVMQMEGNDMEAVLTGLRNAKSKTKKGKPVVILMRTDMGFGVDFMQGTHKWHGIAPNDEQIKEALSQLEETLGDF